MDGTLHTPMPSHIATAIREIQEDCSESGRTLSITEQLTALRKLTEYGRIPTFEPMLPVLFNLRGKPFTLQDHFPFAPMFLFDVPQESVWVAGRQVGKTQSEAASSIAQAVTIPYFSTLFVTPLFEQVKRLSSLYVKPLIESSPVKDMWRDPKTSSAVLQRSFRNGSSLLFSFAFMDVDRLRGVSCSRIVIDECLRGGTLIYTPGGRLPIESCWPGTKLLSATTTGELCEDEVTACQDRGLRDCYRIEFANGAAIEATSDSFIATTAGWKRLETIVGELHAAHANTLAEATGIGDAAGRRQPNQNTDRRHSPHSAQLQTACLQLPKVPGIVRVRTHETQTREEQRLRQMVELLDNAELSGLLPYGGVVSPQRPQGGDAGLAQPADLGGCGLVVSGRRESVAPDGQLSHRGVQPGGSRAAGRMADASRNRRQTQQGAEILDDPAYHDQHGEIVPEDRPLRGAGNAVQNCDSEASAAANLPVLRSQIPALPESSTVRVAAVEDAVLPESRLPARGGEDPAESRRSRSGATRASQRTVATALSRKSGCAAGIQPHPGEAPAAREPGKIRSRQTPPHGKGDGSSPLAALDLSALRVDGAARESEVGHTLLSGMPATDDTGNQAAVLFEASSITSVRWTGRHRVFDLATRQQHNFVAGGVLVHNCQDMNHEHIPIIKECASASEWRIFVYAGTPKTLDNTIEVLRSQSSQAEFILKCPHCGFNNIPTLDRHILGMIGPFHDHISERYPATVCYRCRQPVSPRHHGRWVHAYPKQRFKMAGYHIPQIIMPIHYANPGRWSELLGKQQGRGQTTPAKFATEVLGLSYDQASKLVSLTELQAAATLPWRNRQPASPEVFAAKRHALTTVLAVDWGGGGEKRVSFTSIALLGFMPDGRIDVLWGRRLLTPNDHLREATEVLQIWKKFRPDLFVHDYSGAGAVRESLMIHSGLRLDRIMAIRYVGPVSGGLIEYVPATSHHPRHHYRMDKSRSLLFVTQAIRLQQIRFFQYDYISADDPGLLHDFLALIEEKTESRMAGDVYFVRRLEGFSDDFAQAVNMGAVAIWHSRNAWPDFAELMTIRGLTQQQCEQIDPASPDWSDG